MQLALDLEAKEKLNGKDRDIIEDKMVETGICVMNLSP